MRLRCLFLVLCCGATAGALPAGESPFTRDQLDQFEQHIRPVLIEHCLPCHDANGKKQEGGLSVASRVGLLTGGDSGPAIVPGRPEESLLLEALNQESLAMPPDRKLPAAVIEQFALWIQTGAADPRTGAPPTKKAAMDLEVGRRFWCFQPLLNHRPPAIDSDEWSETSIDSFLRAAQVEAGLAPGPDADRLTLLRRLHVDLTGLPPTLDDIEEFLADDSVLAVDRVVDRLLASLGFGERWGRHWLDVARYADSTGGGRSMMYQTAWRYRDYVIDSFNDDTPIDVFAREQLAGDLLPSESSEQAGRQLIATAFLALGPSNYENQDKDELRMDVVDEQIDLVGRAFLAMTLGCARCHDHKFDPIPTVDYYALAGIFRSTLTLKHDNVSSWLTQPLPLSPEEEQRRAALEQRVTDLTAARDVVRLEYEELTKLARMSADGDEELTAQTAAAKARLDEAEKALKRQQVAMPKRPSVICVAEEETPEDARLAIRGNLKTLSDRVPRGFLSVAADNPRPTIPVGSGRRELADWVASADNPLTARVFVNRVWAKLFGAGLVATVDQFGESGERPSHPELLDALAARFIADNWSTKRLVRRIVLARAYQLASQGGARDDRDPLNRLLVRQNRRPVEAEVLRDACLLAAARLDRTGGGPTVRSGTKSEIGYDAREAFRSVYLPVFRNQLPDLFAAFDFPDPNLSQGQRSATILATQSLLLMNSPEVSEWAQGIAGRLCEEEQDPARRVDRACLMLLGRPAQIEEAQLLLACALDSASSLSEQQRWARICHALICSLDFRLLW